MTISFSKYSGCGNDFILIDNRSLPFLNIDDTRQAVIKLCQRKTGVGADGVVFLENSAKADFRMRIFNQDGSEAEMCGNGLRCLGLFIKDLGLSKDKLSIETLSATLNLEISENGILAHMGEPTELALNLSIPLSETSLEGHFVNTGVPHAVIFLEDLSIDSLENLGREIRYHPMFSPKGTNVNFVKILDDHHIEVDTYERGVEGFTLACGTGAAASSLIASLQYNMKSPISVKVRSGDIIKVFFEKNKENKIHSIKQIGPVTKHFQGLLNKGTL